MTHLSVHEWGRVPLDGSGFSRPQANALLMAARAHPLGGRDGTHILTDHHCYLRAQQMVGVLATPGCSLEILPKVDPVQPDEETLTVRARLVHMLDVALGLGLSAGSATTMAHKADSLLEVFITLFADRLLQQVRRGLPLQYQAQEDDLSVLRGRLDVTRQFTVHAVRPDRLACQFDVLDPDTPLMQIMKACVRLVMAQCRSTSTMRKLTELRFLLSDVSDRAPSTLPWSQVRIDRTSHQWRSLFDLARLLMAQRWQQTHVDLRGAEGMTLLFPMNELFERYVAAQIKRALAGTGLEVVLQGGLRFCLGPWVEDGNCVGDSHATRPDIIIRSKSGVAAIIDTKWKPLVNGIAQSDVYQMMAYARLYCCDRLILLYPAASHSGDQATLPPRGLAGGTERLEIAAVPIEQNVQTVARALLDVLSSSIGDACKQPV